MAARTTADAMATNLTTGRTARSVAPGEGPVDGRLTVRFGDAILARGYTAIPNLVLNSYRRLGVTEGEMLFTIHIWQHWWSASDPCPSVRTIAQRMGKSTRQVQRYIDGLCAKQLLRVVERFDAVRGDQVTNEYDYSPFIAATIALARAQGDGADKDGAPVVRRARAHPGDGPVTEGDDRCVIPAHDRAVTPPVSDRSPQESNFDQDSRDCSFDTSKGIAPEHCSATDRTVTGYRIAPASSAATDDTSQRAATHTSQLRLDPTYQALVGPLMDIAREFGDEAPLRSSVTRAYRLMRGAGLSPGQFEVCLRDAKAVVRLHQASVVKTRADSGYVPRKNLMPYFFATLARLVAQPAAGLGRRPVATPLLPRRPTSPSTDRATGPLQPRSVSAAFSTAEVPAETHPIWAALLADLRPLLTPENFALWLRPARVVRQDGSVLQVAVAKPIDKAWLERKLQGRIRASLNRLGHGDLQIEFVVNEATI